MAKMMLGQLATWPQQGHAQLFRCASACSGTECSSAVWKALGEASAHKLQFQAVFACEINPVKQRWIQQNFPELSIIYKDILELSNCSAMDICSQRPVLSAGEGACHSVQVGLGAIVC